MQVISGKGELVENLQPHTDTITRTEDQSHRTGLSRRRRIIITGGVMMGMFLAALESTVVSTAMPTVIASLGGLNIYSWVFSVYMLTSTVTVPIWGRLSDIYGRRVFYLIGIGLFLLGSALSGQSHTMLELVIFRAIQGLGAGALIPLGLTIIGDMYTLVERARMQGLFSGVWGVASIIGPLVGGFITDHLSWRWVFYINIPFGLAAAAVIGIALIEDTRASRKTKIDISGAVALTAAITLFLLAMMEGSSGLGWGSLPVISMFIACAVLLAIFIYIESRAEAPMLPLSLFSNAIFRAATVNGLLAGMAMFGSISFIPLYVQGVIGTNATQAGSVLTPLLLGWVIFAVIGGRLLLKVGYRPTVLAGMVLLVTGFFMLTGMTAHSSRMYITLAMIMMGAGMGLSMLTLLIAVQTAVPREQLGTATSANMFFRSIGGAIGVAVMGSVMSVGLSSQIASITQVNGADRTAALLADLAHHPDVIINPAARSQVPAYILQLFIGALDHALHSVFLVGLVMAILAFISAFMVPRGRPHEHTANK